MLYFRYGKYKPLTQPSKCTKCFEKRVKSAYQTLCIHCVEKTGSCAKCGQIKELVNEPLPSKAESDRIQAELQKSVKTLPERKRRTFLRYLRQQENSMSIRLLQSLTYSDSKTYFWPLSYFGPFDIILLCFLIIEAKLSTKSLKNKKESEPELQDDHEEAPKSLLQVYRIR